MSEEKKEYQELADKFLELDKQVQELVEKFTSGRILYECVPSEPVTDMASFMLKMVEKWNGFQAYLQQMIAARNDALTQAQNAIRGEVMLSEGSRRGVDGKAAMLNYGPFKVTSKTSRSFNSQTLFQEVQKLGLYQSLLDLKIIDKETGEQIPAVKIEWGIAFEPVKNWLREQNLEGIIESAYVENEGTPAVTGPGQVTYIGEVSKKKK